MKNVIRFFVILFVFSTPYLRAQSVSFPDDARERGYYDRPYKRYEAEPCHSTSTGTYLNSTFDQREIQSEASNQQAVQLTAIGDYVQWTNDEAADGLTIRFSIPDNAAGTGTTGTVALYVNNVFVQDIELNSFWAWQYFTKSMSNSYADNTPNETSKYARMRFDEVRVKLDEKIPKDAIFKLQKVDNNGVAYTIDFVELEVVPAKVLKPAGAVEYLGNGNNLVAFVGDNQGQTIYIPEGKYDVPARLRINGNNTKLTGAGMWYTQLHFTADPAGQNYSARGIESSASNVEVSGLYLTTANERRYQGYYDSGKQVGKGFNGSFGTNSRISDVWVVHFECGAWIDGADGLQFSHCRFRDNYADGTNFSYGSKNCSVTHSSYRNNGDDDMASWSRSSRECYNNLFQYNTSENCWRAAGIGFFGGKQNKALNCVIIDPVESGIRANNDFSVGTAVFSTDGFFEVRNISIYRAGQKSNGGNPGIAGDLWGWRCGALYINSGNSNYDVTNFQFSNIDIYESKGDAIMLRSTGSSKSIKNISFENVNINGVNVSDAGNNFTYFGLYCEGAKGENNNYCIHYYNVPENLKTYQIPATGFTETFGCTGSSDVEISKLCAQNQSIKVGQTLDLVALTTILPVSATDKSLAFAVIEGENSISLDAGGKVTGAAAGNARIRISSAANAGIGIEIEITVDGFAVLGVSLPATLTLKVGETYQLEPVFTPENASNKNVIWSGGSIRASVLEGLVTALNASNTAVTNIKVTTQDGNYSATCVVTVTDATPVISPESENLTIVAYDNTIQISGQTDGEIISVYNLLGTKLYDLQLNAGEIKYIRGLNSGVYAVVAGKAQITKKVIIKKEHE